MVYCEKYLLKEIVEIQSGYSMRGRIPEDPEGQIAMVQMKDVKQESGINWNSLVRIRQVSKREPRYLEKGDVVFSGRGTTIFAAPVTIEPGKVVASPQFFILIPMKGINAIYLSWFINSNIAQKYFWKHAGGSSIINVNRNVLENLLVPVPSSKDVNAFSNLIQAIHTENELHNQLISKRNRLMEIILTNSMENE